MKKIVVRWVLLLVLLAALATPGVALAQGQQGDKFVLGGTYTLAKGDTLDGRLFVFGGIATLEEGSTVTGDAVVLGGTLRVRGTIEGNVSGLGGLLSLEDTAVVGGDVNAVGVTLNRAAGATVEGQVRSGETIPWGGIRPTPPTPDGRRPLFGVDFGPLGQILSILFRSFVWAALAVLLVLLLPRPVERVAQAAAAQPLVAGGLGLLTMVVAPLLLIVTAVTIILIPVSLFGFLVLGLAWGLGIIAIGYELGKRLAASFHQDWAVPLSAAVGVFLLTFGMNSLREFIFCLGWVVPALIGAAGLGSVLLTRFGSQPYVVRAVLPATPPLPPPGPPAAYPGSDREDR